MELQLHSILIMVRFQIKRDVPRRFRQGKACPIEVNGTQQARTVPHSEQSMLLLEQSRFTSRSNASNKKERLRVPHPERLQHIMTTEKFEIDLLAGEFRV